MSEDLDWEKIAEVYGLSEADLSAYAENVARLGIQEKELAAKDARISSLEQTVAKAFLRCQALEEAVKPFAEAFEEMNDAYLEGCDHVCIWDTGADQVIRVGDLRRAHVLCHADASRADSPHRADGAPQSDNGDSR